MNDVQAANGLGWFSLALGATEIAAAPQLCHMLGIEGSESTFRTLGAREIATGAAVLASKKKRGPIWGRVIGDVIDAAVLGSAFRKPASKRGPLIGAIAFVAVAGVVDYLCAKALDR
jgi:hypothetical protein